MKLVLDESDLREALAFWLSSTRMRTPVQVSAVAIRVTGPEPLLLEPNTATATVASYEIAATVVPADPSALPVVATPAPIQLPPDDPRVAEAKRLNSQWGTQPAKEITGDDDEDDD